MSGRGGRQHSRWRWSALAALACGVLIATPARADDKSPALATVLSAVPTLGGAGLAVAGLVVANRRQDCSGEPSDPGGVTCIDHFYPGVRLAVAGGALLAVGPSLGHLYNGDVWTRGLKVRLTGAAISTFGLLLAAAPASCDRFVCTSEALGFLIIIGGAGVVAAGAGIDVANAPCAVSRRNAARRASVTVSTLRSQHGPAPALVVHGTF